MKNSILFLKSRFFLKQILGALLVLFLLVVISMKMLAWTTEHGNYIVVPDLSKKDINEVANILAAQSLRFQVIDSTNFRSDFPKNAVISQKPLAGSEVKVNKKIYLQLNPSGYANISLPELVQVTKRNATSKLQAVGLTVEKVTYIDALGKNMVYGIKYNNKLINPGFKLPKMSGIELICGNGNRPENETPNLNQLLQNKK